MEKTMKKPSKNQVALNLTGGLGNQLFQLAAAIYLANGKEIFVDKSIGEPRGSNSIHADIEDFRLPNQVVFSTAKPARRLIKRFVHLALRFGISSSRNSNKIGAAWINRISSVVLSLHLGTFRRITTSRGIGYAEVTMPQRPYLVGYFQSYKWAQEIESELNSIRLRHERPQLLEYVNLANTEKPLMVHIRLGDYTSISTFGIPTAKYYEIGIRTLIQSIPQAKIWLFSNDRTAALELIPQEHRETLRIIPDQDFSPAETLELMRHCHNYLIANSTFSWWGAFLSYNKESRVIAPQPWFQGEESPKDILPLNWKSIPAFGGVL